MKKAEKYLLVPSTDLLKKDYYLVEENFGGWWTTAYLNDYIEAEKVFDYFGLPEEYQKIIIKVNNYLFRKSAREFVTGFKFDELEEEKRIRACISYENLKGYSISGNQLLFDRIKLNTEAKYYNIIQVLKFLKQVDDAGYLEKYIQSLDNIFMNKLFSESMVYAPNENEFRVIRRKIMKMN